MNDKLDLRSAVVYLGLPVDATKSTGTLQCPCCGRRTLRLDFVHNVYNCPACEEAHGGYMDFWALFRGIDIAETEKRRSEAAKDFRLYVGKENLVTLPTFVAPNELPMADAIVRDAAYNAILDRLPLRASHRQDLINRGLSDAEIQTLKIKSAPQSQLRMILKGIQHVPLSGIPGIYKDSQGYKSVSLDGYLIPQRDLNGRIQGCQVRLDRVTDGGKYRSFSSAGMPNGVKGSNFVHVASKDYNNLDLSKVVITEGPLKADIINHYIGGTIIAVPGVNSLSRLPEVLEGLKSRGAEKVFIAYDMDFKDNIHVKRGLDKLKRLLSSYDLKYTQLLWDEEKGYDDYLKKLAG